MNFSGILASLNIEEEAFLLFMSRSLTFTVDDKYQVTLSDVQGNPVHATLGDFATAYKMAKAGQVGAVQIGDIKIAVSVLAPAA